MANWYPCGWSNTDYLWRNIFKPCRERTPIIRFFVLDFNWSCKISWYCEAINRQLFRCEKVNIVRRSTALVLHDWDTCWEVKLERETKRRRERRTELIITTSEKNRFERPFEDIMIMILMINQISIVMMIMFIINNL